MMTCLSQALDPGNYRRPALSILNHIIGPVMRGPSSSHTAAPYFIGSVARALSTSSGEAIRKVDIRFDPGGSYVKFQIRRAHRLVFRQIAEGA
jgi:L-serine dehydratase